MLNTKGTTRAALLLTTVGIAAGLTACGGSDSGSSSTTAAAQSSGTGAAKAGSLVFGDAAVANSLDPDGPSATAPANLMVLNNVYEGLVNYKFKPNAASLGGGRMLDGSGVAPGLASSWVQTDKGVTFTLRKGIKSQYGNELTSADVKWTYERNIALNAVGKFILTQNGKITAVKTEGKYKFTYVTSSPAPVLLPAMASAYQKPLDSTEVKKHVTSSDKWASKWLTNNTAGFGPYNVASYSSGKSVVLKPSPTYWGTKAQNTVRIVPIPDSSSRLSALEKGDINLTTGLTPTQNQQAAKAADLHTYRFNGNVVLNLYGNGKRIKALASTKVRQAMQYAIPTADIIKQVYLGYAFDPKSVVPTYVAGFTNKYWPYKFDVAKAKQLMAEAGYAKGFSMSLYYASESNTLAQVVPIVQAAYEQIGIKIKLTPIPQAELLTRGFGDRDMDAHIVDLAASVPPEIANLGAIWITGQYSNPTGYSNAEFDKLAKATNESLDPKVRAPINDEMQKVAALDPPTITMAGLQTVSVASGNVEGYSWTPEGSIPFAPLTVKTAK